MTFAKSLRRHAAALTAVALVAAASPALAQDQQISDSHLKAARAAVEAINATDIYDGILPAAAAGLKRELINKNPDLDAQITKIVDEKTLALVPRRADLEKEAALAYAKVMSEEELNAIAAFYESAPGKKLLVNGPLVTREVAKAAQIWQNGIARDLAQQVAEELGKVVGPPKTAEQAPATPGTGETPAPDAQPPADGSAN